ncbi:CaiB/BaiF CoA transferase family protein [Seohaeicola zhoushanensis]|uniref:Alpha-methylacyl-CoA racemase n=1 Tax=Seohaeicola zhoushanensis TaxID=1569283 RepID=A0A8J3MA10_9RHOB|nr:CaiB/BaiF CoA-transferase family protein [Seohaeicola zhoushanensis]GHF53504.1 alpha-methylacyl-CoA racemase [Seohaeicola zhoushanensis]
MLEGIRVIEVEGIGPGPFAGMMLADMGAEVIKVHRPGGQATPGLPDRPILDRGKRSIMLDLKAEGDRATFLRLVGSADALIEGFRPGVMERLGIGPEPCHAANPALVYGRMTGWGQSGALSDRAGHDLNYIGLSGALWYSSPPGETPFAPPTLVGDVGGGAMYLVAGILAGLLRARTSGKGTVVDAAICDGSANMMNLLMTMGQTGNLAPARGDSLLDGPHFSRTYRTADGGFMSVQCLEPKFYAEFLARMELTGDAEFERQLDRSVWPACIRRLEARFAGRGRAEWEAIFEGSDACVAPVLTPQEAMEHPLSTSRGIWVEADGALQAAAAPRFSDAPAWVPRPAPEPGADTEAILAELDAG